MGTVSILIICHATIASTLVSGIKVNATATVADAATGQNIATAMENFFISGGATIDSTQNRYDAGSVPLT